MDFPYSIYMKCIVMIVMYLKKINASSTSKLVLTAPQNETFLVYFNPATINSLTVHSQRSVQFNCSPATPDLPAPRPNGTSQDLLPPPECTQYRLLVVTSDAKVAVPSSAPRHDTHSVEGRERYAIMSIGAQRDHNFTIEAMHIGRVTMSVALLNMDGSMLDVQRSHLVQAVSVTVRRERRVADLVFDSSSAAVAILISFGIGCVTDMDSLKKQLKYPVSLVIGFCCQFILIPVVAFGLAMMLPVDKDVRFGLLCVACVPGGGLGHVSVVIGEADVPLSLTMNMISIVAMLGTAPLWIFVLGQYFHRGMEEKAARIIPIYNFEIWLASTFFAYTFGLVINRFKPIVADAILMWLIKPLLLLATILFITLGVYINMYVFEMIDNYTLLGAILLPLCGCGTGFVLSVACRQKVRFIKSIALESSSFNCLIVLAALRFSLPQPDADLASSIPMWVMFTMPGLYICLAILQKVKSWIDNFIESRREKQCSDYSVVSGVINPPGIAALSVPLFVTDGSDDDENRPNEKVTVL